MTTNKETRRDRVVLTDHPWPDLDVEQAIFNKAGIELITGPATATSAEEVQALIARTDPAAIITCWAPVSTAAIESPRNLRIVARLGVGLDNIAVDSATQRGAWVTNVPDYCVQEVSDHAVALLLAHFRRIVQYDRQVKKSSTWAIEGASPERISELTVGIIGFGRIGRATASRLLAFGCRVLAHGPRLTQAQAPANVEVVDLQTLRQQSDAIVLHLPLQESTHHLVDDAFIDCCTRRPLLVNVSRGGLIDNDALLRGLDSGKLSGAALDVVEGEPQPPEVVIAHSRVIATPHIAFLSNASLIELRRRACEEVVRVLRGEQPLHPCNTPTDASSLADQRLAGGVASDIRLVQGEDGPYVVKQALEKLRVAAEWLSDPARSSTEVAALCAIADLIGQDAVPEVLWTDTATNSFAMRLIDPRLRNWKQDLLAGHIDDRTATKVGALLGAMHARSAMDHDLRDRFDDLSYFETLRIEPYFHRVAQKNPSLAEEIQNIVEGMSKRRDALVHGDFSPKNILADGADVVMLDCEVAHWGDPRFDLAFCLSHLLLKSHILGAPRQQLTATAHAFIEAYRADGPAVLDCALVGILGCLILARLDGDSPVDYLDRLDTAAVRRIATSMICEPQDGPGAYFPLMQEFAL
ncbi:D-3-phosphoglycerate dehydrogenase [compost metagenome]